MTRHIYSQKAAGLMLMVLSSMCGGIPLISSFPTTEQQALMPHYVSSRPRYPIRRQNMYPFPPIITPPPVSPPMSNPFPTTFNNSNSSSKGLLRIDDSIKGLPWWIALFLVVAFLIGRKSIHVVSHSHFVFKYSSIFISLHVM